MKKTDTMKSEVTLTYAFSIQTEHKPQITCIHPYLSNAITFIFASCSWNLLSTVLLLGRLLMGFLISFMHY